MKKNVVTSLSLSLLSGCVTANEEMLRKVNIPLAEKGKYSIMRVLAKIVFLIGALSFNFNAFALTREINIPSTNKSLPLVTVMIENGKTTWSALMTDSDVVESVFLYRLGKSDAKKLLSLSKKARKSYSEIINQGGCPNDIVKSGELGMLSSDGNKMKFEVVCENNHIMVQITMLDEYAINILSSRVDWQDLEKLAIDILDKYQ